MFPQLAVETIIDDLRISGSTQATIENILEGRVGFVGIQEEDVSVSHFSIIVSACIASLVFSDTIEVLSLRANSI